MAPLQSSWVTWPHSHLWHLFVYRVCSRALCSSMQISCHILSDLLLIRVDHCWAQRRYSLKIDQLSCRLILSVVTFHAIHSSWASQVYSSHVCYLSFSCEYSELHHLVLLQPRPSQSWLALWKVWSLLEHLPSSAPWTFVLGSSHRSTAEAWIAWSLLLLSCFSSNYQDDWSHLWWAGPENTQLFQITWRRPHLLLPDEAVCSRRVQ